MNARTWTRLLGIAVGLLLGMRVVAAAPFQPTGRPGVSTKTWNLPNGVRVVVGRNEPGGEATSTWRQTTSPNGKETTDYVHKKNGVRVSTIRVKDWSANGTKFREETYRGEQTVATRSITGPKGGRAIVVKRPGEKAETVKRWRWEQIPKAE